MTCYCELYLKLEKIKSAVAVTDPRDSRALVTLWSLFWTGARGGSLSVTIGVKVNGVWPSNPDVFSCVFAATFGLLRPWTICMSSFLLPDVSVNFDHNFDALGLSVRQEEGGLCC